MLKRFLLILLLSFFLVGCSQKSVKVSPLQEKISRANIFKVVDFKNNTSTPLAGQKVADIVASTLRAKGFYASKDATNAKYIVSGEVNEWRYKTGIDGEAAVSFSIVIKNRDTGMIVFSGVGSKSSDGYGSLGTSAQDISDEIISKLRN